MFLATRQIICIETLQRFGTQSDILLGYGIFGVFFVRRANGKFCIVRRISQHIPVKFSDFDFFLFVAMSKFRVIMYCNHLHHKNIYDFNYNPHDMHVFRRISTTNPTNSSVGANRFQGRDTCATDQSLGQP